MKVHITDIEKIIKDLKVKHNIQDKNFEILALNELFSLPLFHDYDNDTFNRKNNLKRTKDNNFGFVIARRNKVNYRYDNNNEEFETIIESNNLNKSHKVYSENEKNVMKDVYTLFDTSPDFQSFYKNYTETFFEKYNYDNNGPLLNSLIHLHPDTEKFEFLANLYDLENSDKQIKDLSPTDLSMYSDFISCLQRTLPYHSIDKTNRYEQIVGLLPLNFDDVMADYRSTLLTRLEGFFEIEEKKMKRILNTDYVQNNTVTGIVISNHLPYEKMMKIVDFYYDDIREVFLDTLENLIMLKSKEELISKYPMKEFIDEVKEQFPEVLLKPIETHTMSFETDVFSTNYDTAHNRYNDYVNGLHKFGLVSNYVNMNLNQFSINNELFYQESYLSHNKAIILKGENLLDVNYHYVFEEHEYYGLKTLELKNAYNHEFFNDEIINEGFRKLAEYVIDNQCIILYNDLVINTKAFDNFQNFIEDEGQNILFFDKDNDSQHQILNYCLSFKKEYGQAVKMDDLRKFSKEETYNIYENVEKYRKKFEKASKKHTKKNGPS